VILRFFGAYIIEVTLMRNIKKNYVHRNTLFIKRKIIL